MMKGEKRTSLGPFSHDPGGAIRCRPLPGDEGWTGRERAEKRSRYNPAGKANREGRAWCVQWAASGDDRSEWSRLAAHETHP
jgi:hypothetical protein